MSAGPGHPEPAVELGCSPADASSRLAAEVAIDDRVIDRLAGVCATVDTSIDARVAAGRDWWPIGATWALAGSVPAIAGAVVTPSSADEVATILAVCNDAGVAVTPAAGRSGVCGGSVPIHGGVSLDLTGMAGIVDVDDTNLVVAVQPGTWGMNFEERLRIDHGLTTGHWPQSIAISTVGGWLACRGAGQYSTRYGKVEDMVVGLEVALADGRLIQTGTGAPRAAMGPELTQVFLGSEGTLGVITEAHVLAHPLPRVERRLAWAFDDFHAGLEACRRILRRDATPAVVRLYDEAETGRHFDGVAGCALIVLDEGEAAIVDATMRIVSEECSSAAALGPGPVDTWFAHRNEVPSLGALATAGIVADTIEVAAAWRSLPALHAEVVADVATVEGTLAVSAHQSHAYPNGACLYFSFGGRPQGDAPGAGEAYYTAVWDAVMGAVLRHGGAISHHHGIGINRARYLRPAMGTAFDVLVAIKAALDPRGILNPGKLGLPSPFAAPPWP